ncbi:MFS transporter [Sphaerotilus mobilis]|uniref:Putative MFS family arabinose efflux permease n=1 Tax=Sphaerotilus mobilis TaxID=47994 RepID=A0A4Q7LRX9_9BURK|nr:MFS transporter [Sphaerotilus mobilis]RZS56578.1 putative MFS family arabinose efflux permease [Sphaerotilus mobilis]
MTSIAAADALGNPAAILRRDARTIGLVGLVHGTSHFFHLLLPPLFPHFMREFGLSYSQLGLLVTVFFVISGVGQALSGFLVDRIGARPALMGALACFVAAALLAAGAEGYGGLLLASAMAGLGNAPFHPVDFTILNRRVSTPRLGHAYSVHGISGNLGWALSPIFSTELFALTGSLRWTYAAVAMVALLVLAIVWWRRDDLDDRAALRRSVEPAQGAVPAGGQAGAQASAHASAQAEGASASTFGFLRLPSVWLCFSFLFFTTSALAAIQSFASPALQLLHGVPLRWSAWVVSAYMVCGALGMVAGGFLLARAERLEPLIARALMLAGSFLVLAAMPWVPGWLALALVAAAGIGTGLAGPSRDMLIRRAAPPGASGRVYGLVYSGLDLGFSVAAPIFGWLLDRGQPAGVLLGSALALVAAVVASALVGRHTARGAASRAPASA